MLNMKVKFDKVTDVTNFINQVSKLECETDLISGRYIVDAKSIMGIFALDITKEMEFVIHSKDKNLVNLFKEWEV